MIKIHLLLTVVWVLYCFFHSLLAHNKLKTVLYRSFNMHATTYRVLYNLFATASLLAALWFHFKVISVQLYAPTMLSIASAVVLAVVGLAVMVICVAKYFKQLSGLFRESNKGILQTNGLHGWVRHPLYAGTFIFLIGLFLYWPLLSNAIAVCIIIVYTVAATSLEEQKLVQEYGDAYRQYQRRVPMFIPGMKNNHHVQ
ncbi:MAG: isoprenylcysteine carboxylmethyltransferase family protein [Chitinophagaceae bacterium]|nr:MAG: isoprenylcysteine carboxylmethyltransferase family protein [Chitinophagaceae bacterium]